MSIEHLDSGHWLADVKPVKGERFRRRFKTKAEAQRFEALVRQRLAQHPEWNPQPNDRRRLSELVERWNVLHGHALSDGENRTRLLLQLAEDLGDPVALQLTGNQYTEYRAQQLAVGAHGKTLNNRLGYLRAVYNELHQLGEIDYANPLQRVKLLKL